MENVREAEIKTWQAYLQQIVDLLNKGYWFYCKVQYPLNKMSKWQDIDKKLIAKYDANADKWVNYFRKRNGMANFRVLRWQNQAVILHTLGAVEANCEESAVDSFQFVKDFPLIVEVSDNIAFKVLVTHKVEVFFERSCYRNLKASLSELCQKRVKNMVISRFNYLNNIPSYSGIVEQKRSLLRFVIKELRRYQVPVNWKDFSFYTGRKVYKVYSDADTTVSNVL
jgi:hypothetical protein